MKYNVDVRKATRTSGGKGDDSCNKLEKPFTAKAPRTEKATPVAWTFSRKNK